MKRSRRPVMGQLMGCALVSGLLGTAAIAQEATDNNSGTNSDTMEEIVVTGSLIKRNNTYSSATPISVTTLEDMRLEGANQIIDVMSDMTVMGGMTTQNAGFGNGAIQGTATVNLRNLGVQQTLVLLNGRREVKDSSGDFVNINNLVPMIALDRVETLLDGGSSLYGTDAVAGVVNFLTRDDFEGVEFAGEWRERRPGSGSRDLDLQVIVGTNSERGNVMLAAHYLDREGMTASDVDFIRGISSIGQPGSFRILEGPLAGQILPDPTCGDENQPNSFVRSNNRCGFDFGAFWPVVAPQQILNLFGSGSYLLFDSSDAFLSSLRLSFEGGFVSNDAQRAGSPSRPVTRFQTVPAENPGNVFGADALFLGRVIGGSPPLGLITGLQGGETIEAGPKSFDNASEVWRAAISLDGDLPMTSTWTFDLSYKFNRSQNTQTGDQGLLEDEFQLALLGLGGFDCDPDTGTPGEGNCRYFNPFGSFKNVTPDDPRYNPKEIFDFIFADQFRYNWRELEVIDLVFTGDAFALPTGTVAVAVGAQYRDTATENIVDANLAQGKFLLQEGNNFAGGLDAWAVFGEMLIPLGDTAEINLQLRHESLTGDVDTTDPKGSIRYEPVPGLALRASASTAFRVGSVSQLLDFSSFGQNIVDPFTGSQAVKPVITRPNPDLQPEKSTNYNFGFSLSGNDLGFLPGATLNVDFWWYEFEDGIATEGVGEVIARELAAGVGSDPNVIRDPLTNEIERVIRERINAATIETNGVDVSAGYTRGIGRFGDLNFSTNFTYVDAMDCQTRADGPVVDCAGSRNRTSFLPPHNDFRANASIGWRYGEGLLRLSARYLAEMKDDAGLRNRDIVPSFTTFDLQYNLDWGGTNFAVGINNLTNEDPPSVATAIGIEPLMHDPRGRTPYLRIRHSFQ